MKYFICWLFGICSHDDIEIHPSTCAARTTKLNVEFGATIKCVKCKKTWIKNITVGCIHAWEDHDPCVWENDFGWSKK